MCQFFLTKQKLQNKIKIMKIMLIAGEASGDMYGSYLAKEIKKIREDINLFGMGGDMMEKEGVEILFPISCDIIGAIDAIFKIPKAIFLLNNVLSVIRKRKPEIIVLIDFAEFNLWLLKRIPKEIKTAWLFPPTAWAWRKNRGNIVKKANILLSTIPVERDFYEKIKANVIFIGHPLLDIVKTDGDYKKTKPIVSFLPGSRECEIKRHLPVMLEVAKGFFDIVEPFIIRANGVSSEIVLKIIKGLNIKIVNHSYNLIASSDLIITSSGTATLECAILNVPMIVIYKMDRISFFFAKCLVKTKYISLPNIIAGYGIVKEFIQDKANPSNITKEAISILNDSKKRDEIKEGLSKVRDMIGPYGAIKRAANAIVNL